jgi:NCS1 family nucleobase:cation symporter-1
VDESAKKPIMNQEIANVPPVRRGAADLSASPLYSEDFAPVLRSARTWNTWNFAALWIGMAVMIPTYMLASSLIEEGMNWWQGLLTILLGNLIVLVPMILNAHPGTKYGIPLPVLLRASFGTRGAVLAALLRGLVGCGWFGIQTWIGGEAIYTLLLVAFPAMADSPGLGDFIGLNAAQAACFLLFWLLNMWVIYRGIDTIKRLESWAAPLLLLMGASLLYWAWQKVGSLGAILEASHQMKGKEAIDFWKVFWPSLTAMVGFWATLSLNIPDFSRYARSQRAQIYGQALGLPATMVLYSFIGIAVTSATLLIFGEAIWDPVVLLGRFSSPVVVIISMLGLTIATLSTNIAANVVASANDIANIMPRRISFRMGGYLTGLIGILIFPWKLMADPHGFIFLWLIGYSALLGSLAGVMICDYFLIRKTRLHLTDLFRFDGRYRQWNATAWIALGLSLAPVLPGFLVQVGLLSPEIVSGFWQNLYSYAWFITFFLGFSIYWFLNRRSTKGKNF